MSSSCLVAHVSLKFGGSWAPVTFPRLTLGGFSVIPQVSCIKC